MKEKHNSNKFSVMQVFLSLSLLLNALFLGIYIFKIRPELALKSINVNSSLQSESRVCTNVFSKSQDKVVCLTKDELKSQSLSECSKNFREFLSSNTEALKGLRDINNLEKLRDLSIKMCMQEKGYEYE